MRIDGKVANVVPPSRLVINIGRANGVAIGDRGAVFSGIEVKDPETGEALGRLEETKLRFEVEQAEARFSVVRSVDLVPAPFPQLLGLGGMQQDVMHVSSGVSDSSTVSIGVGETVYVSHEDLEEVPAQPEQKNG